MSEYTHLELFSPKDAPRGEFFPHDGSIHINLDEITTDAREEFYCYFEEGLIASIIDILIHEELHKRISESTDDDTFNEQDERIYMVMRDWIYCGIKKSISQYD